MKLRRFAFIAVLTGALLLIGLVAAENPAQAQQVGTNWTGQFFKSTDLSGPVIATVNYPNGLQFNWGQGVPRQSDGLTPVPGFDPNNPADADNFSARFTSVQNITQAGRYRFLIRVNDGVRMIVNGTQFLNRFDPVPDGQFAEYTFEADLFLGNNTMEVQYVDFSGTAILQVQWGFIGGTGVGPLPTATPQPIATASVIRVRGLAVRTGPYLGASLITVARPDNAYEILAKNFDEGLFPWYKIRVRDSIGWASGRYLQTSGDLSRIPEEGTIFQSLGPGNLGNFPPRLQVTGITRAVMNVRARPSERTQIIAQIPWGGEVEVFGRTVQGGQSHWLFIRYGDVVGWIFAPFVGLRGVVDAVPVY